MKLDFKKGFTLIELLVVVAIIGILASLVIASLNQARSRGVDAAIKGTMSSVRAQMEIFYDSHGFYTGACGDTLVTNLTSDVQTKNGGTQVTCTSAGQQWAAASPLVTEGDNGTQYFCVDHTGFAGVRDTELSDGDTLCPAT